MPPVQQPTALKKELGLGDPKPAASTEQADKFKAAFQAASAPINECLQYTAAHAEQTKHDPQASKRDTTCQAYQVALGKIDPTNPSVAQGAIDQVLAGVQGLKSAVESFKAAAEKAFKEWTGCQGEFDSAIEKIRELLDWGDEKASAFQEVSGKIRQKANEKAFADATKGIQALVSKINPPFDQMLKQKAAKEEYDPALAALQPRLDKAKACTYKPLQDGRAELEASSAAMCELASTKDYISALKQLSGLVCKVDEFEAKVAEYEAKKKEYEDARAQVEPKLGEASTCQFKALAELDQQIADLTTRTDAAASEEDYEQAVTLVGELSTKVEEKITRAKEIEAKKAEYEAARQALDPKLGEASTCQFKSLAELDQQIADLTTRTDAAASEEDYEQAVTLVNELTTKVDEKLAKVAELEAKKAEYETARAGVDPKIAEAESAHPYKALEETGQQINDLKAKADAAAGEENYEEAVTNVNELTAKVDEKLAKVKEIEAKKAEYEAARQALDPKLTEASTSQYTALAELDQEIVDLTSKTDAAVTEEDYEQAVTLVGELSAKVDEKITKVKEIEAKKAEYEAARAALDPKLAEASKSQDPDLAELDQQIADLTTKTDAAVAEQDYEQAVTLVNDLSAKVEEKFKAIEQKKQEYETARKTLDGRMATVSACKYKELEAQKKEIEAGIAPIDAAATAQDYAGALKLTNELLAKVDAFETAKTAHEDKLKADINKKLADVKSKLAKMTDTKSPIKGTVEKLVASIEAAVGGSGDLEQAGKDVDEAAKQIAELEQVYDVRKRLEDPSVVKKDEARKIIDELEKSGKLVGLPMEARNALVEKLMEGTLSTDEDAAIQKVFKIPAIDRRFEEKDKATRDKILKAYEENPEVKKIRADWSTMTEAQRKDAVKKLAEIPVGPDGWNVGMPKNFEYTNAPKDADGNILFGTYNYQTDTMSVNLHNDGAINSTDPTKKDPVELLDTIAHELGHKYQRKLVTDLENGKLKEGDPEYEQAKAFKQHEQYRAKSPDGFKKIYSTSPKEAHSRQMGSEIQEGLKKDPKTDPHAGHDH